MTQCATPIIVNPVFASRKSDARGGVIEVRGILGAAVTV